MMSNWYVNKLLMDEAGETPPGGGAATPPPAAEPPAAEPPAVEPPAAEPPAVEPPAPAGGVEPPAPAAGETEAAKRYSELSRSKAEAERRANESEARERLALEALERLTGRNEPPKKVDEDPKPVMPEFKDPEQFAREMAVYTENMVAWGVRKGVAASMAEDRKRQVQETQQQNTERVKTEFGKRIVEATKTLPDYLEVTRNPDLPISDAMASAIAADADGTFVAYHLGKNLEEARRIAALAPGLQLVEFGALKAKLAIERAARQKSNLPPPTKPLGGSSSVTKPVEDLSMDEYAAQRTAKIAAERRPGGR